MYKLQSVLFDKKMFSIDQCVNWLLENGFKAEKVDITQNYFRFRQVNPQRLVKEGYKKVITKDLNNGIKFILYYDHHIFH